MTAANFSFGEASYLTRAQDANWIVLFVLSGVALGLLLNVLFVQERKKDIPRAAGTGEARVQGRADHAKR